MALVNDYEVVVAGLNQMFANYTDRIEVVKLIANREVRERVDIALYDSFGQTAPEADSVERVLRNPLVKRTVVYTWNFQPARVNQATHEGASGYLSKTLGNREVFLKGFHNRFEVFRAIFITLHVPEGFVIQL